MANPYEIPWESTDITPGVGLILNALKMRHQKGNDERADARSEQYLGLQKDQFARAGARESAEQYRHLQERSDRLGEEQRKKDIEAVNALPMIGQAARNSFGYGKAVGNAYGIQLDQEEQPSAPPPSLANTDLFKAAGNAYGIHAQEQLGDAPPAPQGGLGEAFVDQTEDGHAQMLFPDQSQAGAFDVGLQEGQSVPIEGPVQEFGGRPQIDAISGGQPSPDAESLPDFGPAGYPEMSPVEEATQSLESPPLPQSSNRRTFATVAGSRFELPENQGTTGFGPEYDSMYQRLIAEPTMKPGEAMKMVVAQRQKDILEGGRNTRSAAGLSGRDTSREDRQAFESAENEKYRTTADEREKLARINASGRGGPRREDKADLDVELKSDTIVREVLNKFDFKNAAIANRKFNDMASTIEGARNNSALAAVGAGQFVKMAQGGTGVVSDKDMEVFWNRIGGKISPDQVEQTINNWLTGKMGAGKQQQVADAIKQLAGVARGNLKQIGGSLETRIRGVMDDEQVDRYLDTYIPGYRRSPGATPQAPAHAPRGAGKPSRGTGLSREEAAVLRQVPPGDPRYKAAQAALKASGY